MKYHAQQTSMWDAWYLNIKGRIHAFHLQNPLKDCTLPETTAWCVGHAVSDDLLHWQQCARIGRTSCISERGSEHLSVG